MESKIARTLLAYAECIIGALLLIAAHWSLSNVFMCPEDSWDCEGWGMLGAYIAAPAGILLVVSGIALLRPNSLYPQSAALAAIGWLIFWWLA